jgi:hypothetical protein
VLTWQNRITYILERERDLFGRRASRRQVIRTSNAYVFRDPKPGLAHSFSSPVLATPVDPDSRELSNLSQTEPALAQVL